MEAGTVPRVAAPRISMPGPGLIRIASDARLVSMVREGRAGAFDAVYDRHHRGILSFCSHMLGDQHEAEDALQHTFMAAYSSLLASQRPIHLRPWLFAIARNRCYSMLRAQRERPTAELEEPATDGLATEVQRREDLRDLVSDLNRLPEEQRAAIVLAELESLSHAEIADVLGVPRDKVKALVFQARESLLASRTARDTSCHEIRQELAIGRGGALRRGNLRRHLRDCEGCQAYRAQVQRQRRQFGLLLPIAPTILAKEGLLAAAVGAGGAVAAGGSGLIASSALKTGLLKGVVATVIAGIGTLGTVAVSASDLPVRALEGGTASHHAHRVGDVDRVARSHGSAAGSHVAGAAVAVTRHRAVNVAARHEAGVVGKHRHRAAAVRESRHPGVVIHRRGRWASSSWGPTRSAYVSTAYGSGSATHSPPGLAHKSAGGLPPGQAKKLARAASTRVATTAHVHWVSRPRIAASGHAGHGHGAGKTHGHVQWGVTRQVTKHVGHGHGRWATAHARSARAGHGHAAWAHHGHFAGPHHRHGRGHH